MLCDMFQQNSVGKELLHTFCQIWNLARRVECVCFMHQKHGACGLYVCTHLQKNTCVVSLLTWTYKFLFIIHVNTHTQTSSICTKMPRICFLSHGPHPVQNTQWYYEMYSVLLPVCIVTTTVKAMCMHCGRVFGNDSNPCSEPYCLKHVLFLI
jgi:hypothetical protein